MSEFRGPVRDVRRTRSFTRSVPTMSSPFAAIDRQAAERARDDSGDDVGPGEVDREHGQPIERDHEIPRRAAAERSARRRRCCSSDSSSPPSCDSAMSSSISSGECK